LGSEPHRQIDREQRVPSVGPEEIRGRRRPRERKRGDDEQTNPGR